jgi:hypothetical protein
MITRCRHGVWLARALAATALLAVMLLGSLAHGWHHLSEHACESELPSHAEACAVCAALHSAPLPEASATQHAPLAVEHRTQVPAAASAPSADALALAPARAPPTT